MKEFMLAVGVVITWLGMAGCLAKVGTIVPALLDSYHCVVTFVGAIFH